MLRFRPSASPLRTMLGIGVALTLVAFSYAAHALQEGGERQGRGERGGRGEWRERGEKGEETPLGQAMEGMQGGMRGLRRQLENPDDLGTAIATVRKMQEHALVAFANPPAAQPGTADKDAALWTIEFHREILAVAGGLLDVEQALVEGRVDDAKASLGKLNDMKKAGHDKFQVEDK